MKGDSEWMDDAEVVRPGVPRRRDGVAAAILP